MKEKSKSIKNKTKEGKHSARIICHDKSHFWTTQAQFWQWIRELKVVKLHDSPLTGTFTQEHEPKMIMISNNIFNRAHRNHIAEALSSRRLMKNRKT